jgi:hypothetical protein
LATSEEDKEGRIVTFGGIKKLVGVFGLGGRDREAS